MCVNALDLELPARSRGAVKILVLFSGVFSPREFRQPSLIAKFSSWLAGNPTAGGRSYACGSKAPSSTPGFLKKQTTPTGVGLTI